MKRTKSELCIDTFSEDRPSKCMRLGQLPSHLPPVELNLSGSTLSSSLLRSLSPLCHGLMSMNLSYCNFDAKDLVAFMDSHQQYPNLLSINLSYTQVTDKAIAALSAKCPSLISVNLSGCSEISDVALSCLAQHSGRNIQQLFVSGCSKVGDIGVQLIAQEAKSSLCLLDLNDCPKVSDKALVYLGHYCPSLSYLRLKNTGISVPVLFKFLSSSKLCLSELNIQNFPLSDGLIGILARVQPTIKVLDISFCSRVSVNGLKLCLGSLQFLSDFHLFGVGIPDAQLEVLKQSYPSVSFYF